jgi:hypothetical protein
MQPAVSEGGIDLSAFLQRANPDKPVPVDDWDDCVWRGPETVYGYRVYVDSFCYVKWKSRVLYFAQAEGLPSFTFSGQLYAPDSGGLPFGDPNVAIGVICG